MIKRSCRVSTDAQAAKRCVPCRCHLERAGRNDEDAEDGHHSRQFPVVRCPERPREDDGRHQRENIGDELGKGYAGRASGIGLLGLREP